MAHPLVDHGAGVVPPALVPPPPPSLLDPTVASREFSDALFETQELVPEGLYLKLNQKAMALYNSRAQLRHAGAAPRAADAFDRISEQVNEQTDLLYNAQAEAADYQEQLTSATVRIDRIIEERNFWCKCTNALKSVCISAKIPDSKLLEAYERAGVKHRVLQLRERKRKRDDESVTDVVTVETDEESDMDG